MINNNIIPKQLNNYLFSLIKSLSRNEKGYFIKHVSGFGNSHANNYVKIFRAIDSEKTFDEKKILKKNPHFSETQFANIKSYLFGHILDALVAYHYSDKLEIRLRHKVNCVSVLFEKGLFEHSEKLLQKTLAVAVKHDKWLLILELCGMQMSMLSNSKDVTKFNEKAPEIFEQEKNALAKYEKEITFRSIQNKVGLFAMKEGAIKTEKDKTQIEIFEKELNETGKPLTLNAKLFHLNTLGLIYRLKNEQEQALDIRKKIIKLLKGEPHIIKDYPTRMLISLYNIIITLFEQKKFSESAAYVNELAKMVSGLPPKYHYKRYSTFAFMFHLVLLSKTLRSKTEVIALLEKSEKELPDLWKYFLHHDLVTVHYAYTLLWFTVGDFRKSLRYLNLIVNDPKAEPANPLTYYFSRILNLIIHFELGNFDLLDSQVRSTYRYMSKNKKLYEFQEILIDFVRKILRKAYEEKELRQEFELLRDLMVKINDKGEQRIYLDYFDLVSWLESKIYQRNMFEIITEKSIK